jgi:multidrug efflux pump
MSALQQELARVILADPAVESLTSFIGADGVNTTLNSDRISINLKPLDQRHESASDVIRRLQDSVQQVSGIHLYMQPVQNITIDDRVSRTQYQYTLEDPDTNELQKWTGKFVAELNKLPQLEDVATDQQLGARAISLVIDRVTASRLGIAPTTIDNTLYDAFGQREINTLYTQTNQYHVILETDPQWQRSPAKLGDLYIQSNASTGASGASAASSFSSSASAAAGSNALTTAVKYTPSSAVLTVPASAIPRVSAAGASSPSTGTIAGTTPNTTTASAKPQRRAA